MPIAKESTAMRISSLAVILLAGSSILAPADASAQAKVSSLGRYSGYGEARYDGYQRSSEYVTMRDGVRLAVDILRPTKGGVVATERLPVLWSHVRYQRGNRAADGTIADFTRWMGDGSDILIKHGYVVAAVDTRGGGASFGTQQGFFSREETRDGYEITEWLARQPWSTGKIGMIGRSYLGITQLFAASEKPPHLRAIFPEMSVFEWYPMIYPGGIYRDDFFAHWQQLTHMLDNSTSGEWFSRKPGQVFPVDGPAGSAQRDSAIAGHAANRDIFEMWGGVKFRNSVDPKTGKQIFLERGPATYLARINGSGVAVYMQAGWFDAFPRDAVLWFNNLTVPQKLVIGPWFHGGNEGFDRNTERLRWFDYWLKGVPNGIMREPPISYKVISAPEEVAWRSTSRWPVAGTTAAAYYLSAGRSGSVDSRNDGTLAARLPAATTAADSGRVDTTATLGPGTRWAATYGGNNGYPDLAPNDARGLTYSTAPLERAIEVIGHPIVHLWITSSEHDADVFAYLEDIDPAGHSTYVTEGALRASHRKLAPAPFKNFGLPWTRSGQADVAPLPAAPTELVFDLLPTAKRFVAGHRIRLTITGADRDTHHLVYPAVPPQVAIYRDRARASRVVLPVIAVKP
ncbi:MAG: CocE/NonD family hydrolase [Gemmatimonadota bacterium]